MFFKPVGVLNSEAHANLQTTSICILQLIAYLELNNLYKNGDTSVSICKGLSSGSFLFYVEKDFKHYLDN